MPLLAPPFAVEEGAAAVRTGREWLATEPQATTALLADLAGHVAADVDNHGPPAPVLTDVTTHNESFLGSGLLAPALFISIWRAFLLRRGVRPGEPCPLARRGPVPFEPGHVLVLVDLGEGLVLLDGEGEVGEAEECLPEPEEVDSREVAPDEVVGADQGDLLGGRLDLSPSGGVEGEGHLVVGEDRPLVDEGLPLGEVVGSAEDGFEHLGPFKQPDDVAALAGTEWVLERTEQTHTLDHTGLGSQRAANRYVVHPDDIRRLHQGEAFIIHAGEALKLRVRPPLPAAGRSVPLRPC